jgi:hypothetical protein
VWLGWSGGWLITGWEQRRTDWVVGAEVKVEAVGLVEVEGVVVEDADVDLPVLEVVGATEDDARWGAVLELCKFL